MARGSQATRPSSPQRRRAPRGDAVARGGLAQRLRSSAPSRFLFAHPTLSAALLLALPVLVELWPVLVGGDVFSATAVLYKVPPWEPYRPAGLASFENYLLADHPFAVLPWREFARDALRAGELPWWNPHILSGVPFFTNPQTGLFSIFSVPVWLFSLEWGLGVGAALKLWAGGLGTYLLVRELRLGFLPGVVAGISFALCSLNVVWLMVDTLPAVAVLLPWMLWLIERIYRGGRLGSALGLAVVTALALGGGHPGTQVHVMLAAGGYAALRAAFAARDVPVGERMRALGVSAGGMALGVLLMAFMLIPEALSSRNTVGTSAREGAAGTLPGLSEMPLDMIRTVLVPDWWGRPSGFETGPSPTHTINLNYLERTFYAGLVPLLLACMAVGWRSAWRRIAPFAVLGAIALATALHAPGLWWLATHLPVVKLVQNQRAHFVFELAVAVLAAFGLQALLDRPSGQRWRIAVPFGAIVLGLGLLTASSASGGDLGRVVEHFATGADFASAGVVELTSVAWLVLLAVGVAAALLAAWRWPQRIVPIACGLVLLAAIDMLHFASGFNPTAPAEQAIPPRTPAIAFLQRHADEGRVAAIDLALAPDWAMRYGLNDVRGYDPPYPTRRYFDLWRIATPEQVDWKPTMIGGISAESMRVLSVLGARHVLAAPGTLAPERDDPSLRALSVAYDGRDARIFDNARAAPRALVASDVRLTADEDEARAVLVGEPIDLRRVAVVERDQPGAAGLEGARGTAEVVRDEGERVELRATLEQPGLVVLSDSLTDGWLVEVDGEPADALHVNDVMRGVAVPAGTHEVVWSYSVPGLHAGAAISLTASALLAGGVVVLLRRRRAGGGAEAEA
jgi:hypothetical protein